MVFKVDTTLKEKGSNNKIAFIFLLSLSILPAVVTKGLEKRNEQDIILRLLEKQHYQFRVNNK